MSKNRLMSGSRQTKISSVAPLVMVKFPVAVIESDWETATRVHGIFADKCPVYRSLKAAIAMTTELILEAPASVPEVASV